MNQRKTTRLAKRRKKISKVYFEYILNPVADFSDRIFFAVVIANFLKRELIIQDYKNHYMALTLFHEKESGQQELKVFIELLFWPERIRRFLFLLQNRSPRINQAVSLVQCPGAGRSSPNRIIVPKPFSPVFPDWY